MNTKPKLAVYWAASCGGCEVSLLNLDLSLLEIEGLFDFVFCPCLLDTKRSDLEAMADGSLFLTLLNGAIRTQENLDMARLLRRKSHLLVAFGSCAESGGVPALANQSTTNKLMDRIYAPCSSEATDPVVRPQPLMQMPEGELTLPALLAQVHGVHDVVRIDYTIPGCPPEPEQILEVLRALASGASLPTPGSLLGCTRQAVCDECPLEKRQIPAPRLVRTCSALPEPDWCLLEQGFVCVGMATRGGCGARCPTVNMPCTGCYGTIDRDGDPAATVLTAIASSVTPPAATLEDDETTMAGYRTALAAIVDPLGTLCRYNAALGSGHTPPQDDDR
jgi:F420-non-reducing hydrogenase small subunit